MRLLMTLLVRDEDDILEANLEYHLAQGVDFFLATDNRSRDSTPAILRRYERRGILHLIDEPGDDYSQWRWVTRMARLAATDFGADWVINSDADEFWWPEVGTLRSSLASVLPTVGIVEAPRHNFVPRPSDGRAFFEKMVFRESVSRNAIDQPLPPKVCHRASAAVTVEQGNHRVSGLEVGRLEEPLIQILHFPMRTYGQFENKIRLGGSAYARNRALPAGVGMTWRHLYDLYQAGGLPDFYASRVAAEESIPDRLRAGELEFDDRLRQALRAILTTPPPGTNPARTAG